MSIAAETDLDARSRRLARAYDPAEFASHAATAAELLCGHVARIARRAGPVWPAITPDDLLSQWPDPEDAPADDLAPLMTRVLEHSTHQHHPGFVGQQLSVVPPMVGPIAMLGAILNNSAAIFQGAPVAVVLERRIVEWMNRKVGYGAGAGGTLTSGGTLGALTALLAMRQARMGGDPWQDGLAGMERCAVLVSGEAHYCNARAAAILGFGDRAVISVDTDARFAMTDRALIAAYARARDRGLRPLAVVANAGSTATGTYDDLEMAATFCEVHGLWLHVDAAHGGGALLSEKYRGFLHGIMRADSVVWDAHKMLLMPSNCTAVLFRDGADLTRAFRQQASYLLSGDEAPWYEPAARNFETTKPTFVVPFYVALRVLGTSFFAEYVEYTYDLARAFAEEVSRRSTFELLTVPEANIVCFRLRGEVEDCDALQVRAREAVNRRGRFFIMRARLRGATWLRVVLMNPLTRLSHLRELLDELEGETGGL